MKTAAILTLGLATLPLTAEARTEISWWHAMSGANAEVVAKIAGDFKASGLTFSEGELRSKMDELASIAREQIRAGE